MSLDRLECADLQTYLIVPRPKRPAMLYALALNHINHGANRYFRANDSFDNPRDIDVAHVTVEDHQQSQRNQRGNHTSDSRSDFARMHGQNDRVIILSLQLGRHVLH